MRALHHFYLELISIMSCPESLNTSAMDFSAESSSSSVAMMVAKLLSNEKEGVRRWLRAEMDLLVDPLVNSLFHKITTKLTTTVLAQKQSSDDCTDLSDHNSNPPANVSVHDQIECATKEDHLDNLFMAPNAGDSQKDLCGTEYSHQTEISNSATQSLIDTDTGNVENSLDERMKEIKQFIMGDSENELVIDADREDQTESNQKLVENGGVNGEIEIMQKDKEDDDSGSVQWIEVDDEEKESVPVKKARLDTTQLNIAQSQLVASQRIAQSSASEMDMDYRRFDTLQLKCHVCPQMFADKDQMYDHMRTGHGILRFRCSLKNCRDSFNSTHLLADHIKQVHSHTTDWQCHVCSRTLPSYKSLAKHTAEYHHLGRYRCLYPNCGFIGDCTRKVYLHQDGQHKTKKVFVCVHPLGCCFRTSNSTIMKAHERTHLGTKPFSCGWPACGYVSSSQSHTINHILMAHFRSNSVAANAVAGKPIDYLVVARAL